MISPLFSFDLSMLQSSFLFNAAQNHGQPAAHILVVEDNDVLRDGLRLLLEVEGYFVISAANGREALDQMSRFTPDLILSDINMPEMDGYTFFEAVRSRPEWVPIPFIFLTARGGREDVFAGKSLGADDYLIKPVNRQELVATVKARLIRSQELLFAQLQQAYEASLIMLSNAIELRDQYTRGHVERVMAFTMAIARALGYPPAQLPFLQFGSILHDIGKIYIGEDILRKSRELNSGEWSEMRRHPELGADLVKNIPFLQPAIPIIRHHHERWDGRGYPDGLAGSDIPFGARIVAVADALDAMTSARTYQRPCRPEVAYREIIACNRTRYDPEVVDAFRSIWGEIQTMVRSPGG